MNNVTLPRDLTNTNSSELEIVDYITSKESSKQQVNLSMNTFSFLLEGHKEVISDTSDISISNTEFLLMKSGKCLMTEKFATSNDRYRSILLFFSNEMVLEFSRKYDVSLSNNSERKAIQSLPFDQFISSFVQSLIELNKLSEPTKSKLLHIKFEELMLYLTDTLGLGFLESLLIDVNDYSSHFLEVIENNKLNKLTLSELAFLCNMSLSTFKREFEKRFHTSPSKWFQERRLEYSVFLLKNESKRPSDIYHEIGYDSLTNFIQAFKIKYGKTPKQYQLD